MGPLIPQGFISGDLNFFFAFIIGIAFGYILEQAGFSSSRKLAGVFYGYDFVVLKVFFTAGVTAATGLFFLKYMNWVDFDFLYVNPLYVWSALAGGVIMGFGFILGGFCPGTSLAAAVIGKIDAMVFIGGMFIGILIFGAFYPSFEALHTGSYLGNVFIYDTLGISQSWFLFFLIFMAIAAFVVTQLIENSATKFKDLLHTQKLSTGLPMFFLIILAFLAVILPQQRKSYLSEPSKATLFSEILSEERYINYDKLAYNIINNTDALYLIDVRNPEIYKSFHLPQAVNIPLDMILDKGINKHLKKKGKITVLYAHSTDAADKAWFVLRRSGMKDIKVLRGGLNTFFEEIFAQHEWEDSMDIEEISRRRFIENARRFFKEGGVSSGDGSEKNIPEVSVKAAETVKGGC